MTINYSISPLFVIPNNHTANGPLNELRIILLRPNELYNVISQESNAYTHPAKSLDVVQSVLCVQGGLSRVEGYEAATWKVISRN